jgi:hypothetical protein
LCSALFERLAGLATGMLIGEDRPSRELLRKKPIAAR